MKDRKHAQSIGFAYYPGYLLLYDDITWTSNRFRVQAEVSHDEAKIFASS